jgi:hypothetical protein
MFQIKVVEKLKIQISYPITLSPENLTAYEIVEIPGGASEAADDNMAACCMMV